MRKNILLFALSAIIVAANLKASEKTDSTKIYFENSFTELRYMLEGKIQASFERAVFVSENPYWNNKYSFENFKKCIDEHLFLIEKIIAANDRSDTMNFNVKVNSNGRFKLDDIRYTEKEKKELYLNALKNWAVFSYMKDTLNVSNFFYHLPFSYASNDPFGKKEWGNSQVLNLLASGERKGNCFALTGFFKILADRLNSKAKICTAPQHIYIQHQDTKGEFYNVELATAGHPGDGMIQTLTYTTNEAIMSGIALRDYNEKQNIGLCIVNLAKSYEHKFNSKDDDFILKCAELALKHDSLNLNALLLKQQVLDERITSFVLKNKINDVNRLKTDKKISGTYSLLQKHLSKLYTLGYRQMPLYMQQMILNGFSDEQSGSVYAAKNPSPFTTTKPKDKSDEQYWTLSHGTFQEVFEHKKLETYGHFTFNTETKTISAVDTTNQKGFIIDPVAFAYDFGARMYDSRIGIFISVDPLTAKYPQWSPYSAFANNPIFYTDPDGKEIKASNDLGLNAINSVFSHFASFSTSQRADFKKQDVSALFALDFNEGSKTYFSADESAIGFNAFKARASSNYLDISTKELKKAYGVYLKVQSSETIEVESWQRQGSSPSLGTPGAQGSVVEDTPGYDRLTINTELNNALNSVNQDNQGTIDKLFNPNDPTYKPDDRGNDWVQFNNQNANSQVQGVIVLKEGGNTGGKLIEALTKDEKK